MRGAEGEEGAEVSTATLTGEGGFVFDPRLYYDYFIYSPASIPSHQGLSWDTRPKIRQSFGPRNPGVIDVVDPPNQK